MNFRQEEGGVRMRKWEEILMILKKISNQSDEIWSAVKPIREPEQGIRWAGAVPQVAKEFFPNRRDYPVIISFRTTYPGWLEIQKSKEWKNFEKYLREVQKRDSLTSRPKKID